MSDTPITDAATAPVFLTDGKAFDACDPEVCRDLERRLTALEAQHRERVAELRKAIREEIKSDGDQLARALDTEGDTSWSDGCLASDKAILEYVASIFGPEPKQTT